MLLRFTSIAAAAAVLALAQTAGGQDNKCMPFRLLSQQTLDLTYGYIGPSFGLLGDEVLTDMGKARPPVRPPTTTCLGMMCVDKDAQYLYDFGNGDTMTLQVETAAYPQPPAFGTYSGTNKVVAGTGRFRNVTGIVKEKGPYFAWVDSTGQLQAKYNGEMQGTLCGVLPRK